MSLSERLSKGKLNLRPTKTHVTTPGREPCANEIFRQFLYLKHLIKQKREKFVKSKTNIH
jgi:hypothetical protein